MAQNLPGDWLRKDFDTTERAATRIYNMTCFFKSVCLHGTFKMPIGNLKDYQLPLRQHGLKGIPFGSSRTKSEWWVVP